MAVRYLNVDVAFAFDLFNGVFHIFYGDFIAHHIFLGATLSVLTAWPLLFTSSMTVES